MSVGEERDFCFLVERRAFELLNLARWKQHEGDASGSRNPRADGRLGDACFRLLAALVLTTTMHPGTLMADLGAAAEPDSPTVRDGQNKTLLKPAVSALLQYK